MGIMTIQIKNELANKFIGALIVSKVNHDLVSTKKEECNTTFVFDQITDEEMIEITDIKFKIEFNAFRS